MFGHQTLRDNVALLALCDQPVESTRWEKLEYFHTMLAKHLDLVERRLLNKETIPQSEKDRNSTTDSHG